jgi:hypothetical protein
MGVGVDKLAITICPEIEDAETDDLRFERGGNRLEYFRDPMYRAAFAQTILELSKNISVNFDASDRADLRTGKFAKNTALNGHPHQK